MPDAYQAIAGLDFRLIVDSPSNGPWNMAVDEALMEHSGTSGSRPLIRFYGFSPPVLSVGRFQTTEGVFDFKRLADDGVELIRRPSGGQAVYHCSELTYSVVIGRHHLAGAYQNKDEGNTLGKREVYRFIVPLLLEGLRRLSIVGRESPQTTASVDPDCFAAAGEYEIDGDTGKKLIGSAQMVTRGSVLQHGSIPLDGANRDIYRYFLIDTGTNASSSLSEELGRTVTYAEARDSFAEVALEKTGAAVETISNAERLRAETLLTDRYGTQEWNRKY